MQQPGQLSFGHADPMQHRSGDYLPARRNEDIKGSLKDSEQ
jgi:hypothetical protein